eukprot:1002665-Amphidinium_carterae.3
MQAAQDQKEEEKKTGFSVQPARSDTPKPAPAARRTRHGRPSSAYLKLNEVPGRTGSQELAVPGLTGTSSAEPGDTGHLFPAAPSVSGRIRRLCCGAAGGASRSQHLANFPPKASAPD